MHHSIALVSYALAAVSGVCGFLGIAILTGGKE